MRRKPAERLTACVAALIAGCLATSTVIAKSRVTLSAGDSVIAGAPAVDRTITLSDALPPVLRACLFDGDSSGAAARTITHKALAADCVVPYVNGLWLDPKALLRGQGK